jgi:general secretion pathway protein D
MEAVERDRTLKVDTQNKIAELVEQFNQLMDERRYPEAEMLARQARELDPENPVTQTLTWKAKFAIRIAEQNSIKDLKEAGFYEQMTSVDRSSIPYNDENPIQFDAKRWGDISVGRRKMLERQQRRLSPAEQEIQRSLSKPVDVRFDQRPLKEVLETLGAAAGINIHLDNAGLGAEGVTSDTPVSINLTQPISLKSALNLILEQLRLSYVIQNEVLKVTSEQTRDADVYTRVYDVADLVIPIPNFTPGYNTGLPAAIMEAHRAIGVGGFAGGGAAPMTLAANQPAATNGSVLAQLGAGGLLPGQRGPQSLGSGPGGLGGGAQADFDSLIELVTTTVNPQSWTEVGGSGSIEAFPTNLSIVVSTTQETHDQIADLLEQLRRLQDLQVTIEVKFITLRDNFFERMGIDFNAKIDDNSGLNAANGAFPDDNGPSYTVGLQRVKSNGLPLPTADLDIPFTQDSFTSTLPQFGGFDPNTAANFGFAILSDIEVYMLLQAAQGDQRSNVLQAPKVTLFNGQQASVSDTSQRPFVTSLVPVVGDFAAAHQPVIVVLNEGTSLSVQAVVSSDKRFVRLTLVPFFSRIGDVQEFTFSGKTTTKAGTNVKDPSDPTKTIQDGVEVTKEGTTLQLPTFAFTTVTTTVSVPDGGTVLLGGIKRLSEARSERGVPMLNKIPYINRLFKNVGIGRETSSLMLMVTPRIIIQEEEERKLGIDLGS